MPENSALCPQPRGDSLAIFPRPSFAWGTSLLGAAGYHLSLPPHPAPLPGSTRGAGWRLAWPQQCVPSTHTAMPSLCVLKGGVDCEKRKGFKKPSCPAVPSLPSWCHCPCLDGAEHSLGFSSLRTYTSEPSGFSPGMFHPDYLACPSGSCRDFNFEIYAFSRDHGKCRHISKKTAEAWNPSYSESQGGGIHESQTPYLTTK